MARSKLNSVERDLLEGFGELASDLKDGVGIEEKYTRHRLNLELRPNKYGPKEVQAARHILKASQTLFAQFLGVSPKTVRGWESGKRVGTMASRFMDEIRHDPDYWRNRLRESAKPKTPRKTLAPTKRRVNGE